MEILNFKDKNGLKRFKGITEESTKLFSVFDTNDTIEVQSKRFLKELDRISHQFFKKIRVKASNNKEIDKLFGKQKQFKHKEDKKSQKNFNMWSKKLLIRWQTTYAK